MSSPDTVKQCCARLYESDFAKLLLGESFHPGGAKLTERLGELLGLGARSRVLDIASGTGTSALFLAERFGCEVVGLDYGRHNVEQANAAATARGLDKCVNFRTGDAERLPFPDVSFDAVICECAFCTFPDKTAAAREFARVLRSGGGIGLSDLTRGPVLREELSGLLAWVACIADARPVDTYVRYLCDAGFRVERVEPHDEALLEMVNQVRTKLLGTEILVGLKKLELPGVDFTAAKEMARSALSAVREGSLGYAILHASKPNLII
jgi:ubiquinone/menaquinone biosynthesis C-methylase UbiE